MYHDELTREINDSLVSSAWPWCIFDTRKANREMLVTEYNDWRSRGLANPIGVLHEMGAIIAPTQNTHTQPTRVQSPSILERVKEY